MPTKSPEQKDYERAAGTRQVFSDIPQPSVDVWLPTKAGFAAGFAFLCLILGAMFLLGVLR